MKTWTETRKEKPGWMRSDWFRTFDQVATTGFISLAIVALILFAILALGCSEGATETTASAEPGITITVDENGLPIDVSTVVGKPGEPFEVTIRNGAGRVIEQETFDGDLDDLIRLLPPDALQAMERGRAERARLEQARADSVGTEVRK